MDCSSQQTHFVYIQCLALDIFFSHKYFAFHSHQSCSCGRCHTMLACSGLCNHTGLTHFLCQQHLSQHIVDFMSTGMVQIFTFQINLCSTQILCHFLCKIQSGRTTCIIVK